MRLQALSSRRDFDRVWRAGSRARRDGVVASVVPTTDGKERLGLIARADRAVDRNRIKRRLRSAYDRCEASGIDAVVTGDNSVAEMPFDALVENVSSAVRTARRGLK